MEYDTTTKSAPVKPSLPSHATSSSRGGDIRIASSDADVSVLSQPLTFPFSGRTVKNRFLKAPMTERLCYWPKDPDAPISDRGMPTPEYTRLYQRWGEGEIGMIVSGNTMIRYDAVEAFGNPWAGNEFAKPRPMTKEDIKQNVQHWGETAYWCHKAGFDGVQVHCAHGYLLAQFLSPSTNKRTDEYGGGLENRSRIVFEIIAEIHRRVPDPSFIICVKLNSVEFQDKGTTPEDSRQLALRLEEARVDFVDLSGGTFEARAFEHKKESTKSREAYFIEFAEQLRPLLKKTKVYVTGGLRTAGGMVKAVRGGACDGVGLGRPLAAEPYLCKEILEGKVTGAIENYVPLPMNTQSSGTQLQQCGHGEDAISDWSVESEVKRWIEANEIEAKRKEKLLPLVDSSGYPYITPEKGFAYLKA